MKPKILTLLIISSVISCTKQKEVVLSEPESSINIPSTQGSWWKYHWYRVDSLGNETLLVEKDCVYVVQDTLIGGSLYTHFSGDYFIFENYNRYWKDSSGFIVNEKGEKLFKSSTSLDTFDISYGAEDIYTINPGGQNQKAVPAGIFTTINSQFHHRNPDGSQYTNCEDSWVKNVWYADGIGLIAGQTGYISTIKTHCGYDEFRLFDYYIAP